MSLSFIHCGDLHLGFNQYNEEERFHDFGRAFAYIVDEALRRKVDFFVIAGDLFNKRSINSRTLVQAIAELQKLRDAQIPVIAIEGNHDKAPYGDQDSWMWFLNDQGHIHLLTPFFDSHGALELRPWDEPTRKGTTYTAQGIRFIGMGYQGSLTGQRIEELDRLLEESDEFTVLLLHSAIDQLMHLGGVRLDTVRPLRNRVDYVAMGHIHGRYEVEGWIHNPGCPECWDIKEYDAEKGFYHVTIDHQDSFERGTLFGPPMKVEYIPSKRRDVYSFSIDISEMDDLNDIENKVLTELRRSVTSSDQPMVKVNLYGQIPINPLSIDVKGMEQKVKEELGCLIVEIQNDASLQSEETAVAAEGLTISREQLEMEVLGQLLLQQPDVRRYANQLVPIAKTFKDQVLQQHDTESIAALIERFVETTMSDEDLAELWVDGDESSLVEEEIAAGSDRVKGEEA
jgi:exonuclease SbcD